MIDHVNIPVTSLPLSRAFYAAVLDVLGYGAVAQDGPAVGFGRDSWSFGIEETRAAFPPMHLAFAAASREEVRAFHRAALDAGARCNGAPGLRAVYGPEYYAAYVLDPDGHNIEVVYRG